MSSNNDTTVTFTAQQYQMILTLGNAANAAIQLAKSQGQPPPAGVWRKMYNYILKVMSAENITGAQAYWFQEAGAINANDQSNPAGFFVRDITAIGFGTNINDPKVQDISDTIGANIFKSIVGAAQNGASSLSFNAQLTDDISTAINNFGLPIGSWGGSFYFWNFNYTSAANNQLTTVGQPIESSANQTAIFETNNAQAMADTLLKYGIGDLSSNPLAIGAFRQGFANLALGDLKAKAIGFELLTKFAGDVGSSQQALQFFNLIGAGYNDGFSIAEGTGDASGGSGPTALFGGQTPIGVGNDTLNGGSGADTYVFALPSEQPATETINPLTGNGQIAILDTSGDISVLGGTSMQPFAAVAGINDEWEDSQATLYTYVPGNRQLTIADGALGAGNEILVNDFDIEAATSSGSDATGFLGLYLANVLTLTANATAGGDPPPPSFTEGSTESYTLSVDSPSTSAQTITVTLADANSSDFEARIGTVVEQLSPDGTFSATP